MKKARLAQQLGWTACVLLLMLMALSALPTHAGNVFLTNNTGDTGSSTWFISGESSLILNRFDLASRGITLPVRLDKVSLSVVSPRPGTPVAVAVYQDANGGSPTDATLVRQAQVDITTAGVFTYTFPEPLSITQPFVWVGFYLPVDFQFRADLSGTSQLTWWAWQPGATFDIASLSSAGVVGPADGTAPVSLNMNGVARITAELISDTPPANLTTPVVNTSVGVIVAATTTPPIRQIVGTTTDLSPMVPYNVSPLACNNVLFDFQDIVVSYRSGIRSFCNTMPDALAPASPAGYTRGGFYYDISIYGVQNGTLRLPYRFTHCIRPPGDVLDRAVIGLAYGAPRRWEILPSVRFGELVCAELWYAGSLSYFIPNS